MSRIVRELELDDYYKGFLDLLAQLTRVNVRESEEFKQVFDEYQREHSRILVIEEDGRLVATGKILIEKKFHNTTFMGHIEDVVVDEKFRSQGLGKQLVGELSRYAFKEKCYKVCLNCNPDNVPFYLKCGFILKGSEMCVYQ